MNVIRITVITLLGVLCFGLSAIAGNPVTWNYYLETYGSRSDWYSTPSFIDPGYSSYQYSWETTSAEVRVMGSWYAGPSGDNGSGTIGPLPISNMLVYHIDEPEIDANIFLNVDSSGYGNIYIDNITFGKVYGYDVTGIRFWGNATITPEPVTICLLGLGGLALRIKRWA
jgi:hypothetical protein